MASLIAFLRHVAVVQLPIRAIAALWLLVCTPFAPTAEGIERTGDAAYAYELGQYAGAVTAIEMDYLSLVESVSGKERFCLYRNYDQLMGAWLQVDSLKPLLGLAIGATSTSDEEKARSMLRDHARYSLWELDNAIAELEKQTPDVRGSPPSRANERARSLLSNVRYTVSRLLADHCASAPCIIGP